MEFGSDLPFQIPDYEYVDGPNLADIISKQNDEMLKMLYGAPKEFVKHDILVPMTPNESIARAGASVLKQQRKGFRCNIDPQTSPIDVYRESVFSMMMKAKKSQALARKEYKKRQIKIDDPNLQYWHSTESVTNAIRDIRSLPFIDDFDREHYVSKFIDIVTSIVHRVQTKYKARRECDETRSFKQGMMTMFVTEVRNNRVSILREAFESKQMLFQELPKKLQKEFPELKPQEPSSSKPKPILPQIHPREKSYGMKIIAHGMRMADMQLPDSYKLGDKWATLDKGIPLRQVEEYLTATEERLTETLSRPISRPRTEFTSPRGPKVNRVGTSLRKRSTQILTQPCLTPNPVIHRDPVPRSRPKTRQLSRGSILWKWDDPLPKRDGPYIDTLTVMKNLTELDFQVKPEEDEEEFKCPEVPDKENVPKGWNAFPFDASSTEITAQNSVVQTEPLMTPNIRSGNYGALSDDQEYLLRAGNELLLDCPGDELHDQLNEIWNDLGFSFTQKLSMVVKYSEDSERGARLSEAITYWTQVRTCYRSYDSAYRSLKDFLKLEYQESPHKQAAKDILMTELKTREDAFKGAVELIKSTFGDEVIVQRRRADDILQQRSQKLAVLERR